MYTMYISSVSNCKYDAIFFRLCLCDLVLAATKQRRWASFNLHHPLVRVQPSCPKTFRCSARSCSSGTSISVSTWWISGVCRVLGWQGTFHEDTARHHMAVRCRLHSKTKPYHTCDTTLQVVHKTLKTVLILSDFWYYSTCCVHIRSRQRCEACV